MASFSGVTLYSFQGVVPVHANILSSPFTQKSHDPSDPHRPGRLIVGNDQSVHTTTTWFGWCKVETKHETTDNEHQQRSWNDAWNKHNKWNPTTLWMYDHERHTFLQPPCSLAWMKKLNWASYIASDCAVLDGMWMFVDMFFRMLHALRCTTHVFIWVTFLYTISINNLQIWITVILEGIGDRVAISWG